MKRTGRVSTNKVSDTQCKHTGHDNYGYCVQITCHEDNKDAQGFIIDNMVIQGLMQDIFNGEQGGKSCETLVCCMGKTVKQTAEKAGVMVHDIYVHLFPVEGSTPLDVKNMASFEYSLSGTFNN